MRKLALAMLLVSSVASVASGDDKFEVQNNRLVVPHPVTFAVGSDKLHAESDAAVDYVKRYLEAKSYISLLRIEVHSDSTGNEAMNQKLSEQRALAVGKALIGRGVDCKRLLPVGFGSTKPVAANDTPENKAKNRRVTFENAALRGRPIGGMPVDGGGKVAGDLCAK
jgi:OmpA-OmpF porin, OOP family